MRLNNASQLVRKCFAAWETKDRAALEELLAEDFTFTSPNARFGRASITRSIRWSFVQIAIACPTSPELGDKTPDDLKLAFLNSMY
jgi:Domain of unknown function (DUF4440)